MRIALVLAVAGLVGCIHEDLVPCGTKSCAAGAICLIDRETCAFPDALAACDGMPDGALCQARDIDGACDRGLCVQSLCGDGVTTGREQCDGTVSGLACGDFRYYYGALACTSSCLVDQSGCYGSCGDGLIQTDQGEVCDGNIPTRGCVDLGYDFGHIHCTARCTDSSPTDCGFENLALVFAGNGTDVVTDAWRDGDVFVVTRTGTLIDIDQGVRHDFTGAFTRIAGVAGTIVASNADHVVTIDHGNLVPLPDLGANGAVVVGLAYAPTGELWALTSACDVRVLVAGAWQTRPSYPATTCELLAIDPGGDVYASTGADVQWFDGTMWIANASPSDIYALNQGPDRVLAVTAFGSYLLDHDKATPTPIMSTWFDAVAVGRAYFAVGIAPARWLDKTPTIYNTTVPEAMSHTRKMRDGSILTWDYSIYELDSLFSTDGSPTPGNLVRAGTTAKFIFFKDATVYQYRSGGPTQHVSQSGYIVDAAISGDTIYMATTGNFEYGSFSLGWTRDLTHHPSRVWTDAAGDLAIIEDGAVKVQPAGGAWSAALPAHGCGDAVAIAAVALDEIYVSRLCMPSYTGEIDVWDGTQWTQLRTEPAALSGQATRLPDDTIVFTGQHILIGRGTTWNELANSGDSPSGTSATDIWFGNVQKSQFVPPGIAHWDGSTLASVRYPGNVTVSFVAADADSVFVVTTTEYRVIARMAVP